MKIVFIVPIEVLNRVNYTTVIFFLGQKYPKARSLSVFTDKDMNYFEDAISRLGSRDKIVGFDGEQFYEVIVEKMVDKEDIYN